MQSSYLQAQYTPLRLKYISVADGLVENSGMAIHQDKLGFIWISTQQGIHKFDGYEFTIYQYAPKDSTTILNNALASFFEDDAGNIIAGIRDDEHYRSLSIFDRKTQQFRRMPNPLLAQRSWVDTDLLTAKTMTPDAVFWYSSLKDGILAVQTRDTGYWHLRKEDGLLTDSVELVKNFGDQLIWVGYHRKGISAYHYEKRQWQHFPAPPSGFGDEHPPVIADFSLYRDSFLCVAVGTRRSKISIWKLDLQQKTWHRIYAPYIPPWNSNWLTFVDQKGNLWTEDEDHTVVLNLQSGKPRKIPHDQNFSNTVMPTWSRTIYEDHSGMIWLGTRNYGIFKWDPYAEKIKMTEIRKINPKNDAEIVRGITEDSIGNIWLGGSDGLKRADYNLNTAIESIDFPYSISTLFTDQQNNIWISTKAEWFRDKSQIPLWEMNPEERKIIPHSLNGLESIEEVNIIEIVEDPKGRLWLANHNRGLIRYEPKNGQIRQYLSVPNDPSSLPSNWVTSLLWDEEADCLWVGNSFRNSRFCRFDPETEVFTTYPLRPENDNDYYTEAIQKDRQNRLWVGGFAGLYFIDQKSGANKRFGIKDGLPQDIVYEILEDQQGYLWLFQEYSVSKIRFTEGDFPDILSIDNYDQSDGLQNSRLHPWSIRKSRNGDRAYMGGSKGINHFYFDQMASNPFQPQLVFTHFKIKGKAITYGENSPLDAHINVAQSVRLDHDQNDIAISFAALHFSAPENNQYAFRLVPYQGEWSQPSTNREAVYTNLAPGEYTFELRGSNSDGGWNKEGISLEIVISPAWWETRLAMLLYLLLVLGAIWAFIYWRLHYMRLHYERQAALAKAAAAEAANEAKSTFLSTVSHELRTPLTSIIGFTKINKKNLEEKVIPVIKVEESRGQKAAARISKNLDIIEDEGQRLTALINELLDLAKIEAGKIEWKMEEFHPDELIERAVNSTASLFEQKPQLELIKDIPQRLPTINADRDRLLQVLINLISNAVKFTDTGQVKIGAKVEETTEDKALTFFVQDSGSGIPSDQLDQVFERFKQVERNQAGKPKGTGLGLPICKEIVEYHGGRIWVDSELGQGSVFVFTIPLSSE